MTLRDDMARVVEDLRREARRMMDDLKDSPSTALAQLATPNLGPTPRPLRAVLEPVVALSATAALGVLFGISAVSLAVLFVAAALIYIIITYVFGIELGVEIPAAAF